MQERVKGRHKMKGYYIKLPSRNNSGKDQSLFHHTVCSCLQYYIRERMAKKKYVP